MDLSGQYRIPAPREKVWRALNDTDVLHQSIPGCHEMKRLDDDKLEAAVTAKVGPVKANFTGTVTLSNLNPPESYTISGEGKGGAAGFAKGSADVKLTEDGDDTVLEYNVHASVGGKLAQVGGRLIDSTAKKMADQFFTNFNDIVSGAEEPAKAAKEEPAAAEQTAMPEKAEESEPGGIPVWAWATAIIVLALAVLWYFLT